MSKGKIRELLKDYQRMKPLIAIKEYLMIIVATIPYAIAVNWILVPHTIVGGGLTGLCEIIYFATDTFVPIWLSSFVCNLALLIAAFFTVGWRYCVRTLWGVLWYTIWLKVIEIPAEPVISDPFMAVILGALFMGSFLGIVFMNNGSTGGVDIVAMIVNKYYNISYSRVVVIVDVFIIGSSLFIFGDLATVIYGYVVVAVFGYTVDIVLEGDKQSLQIFVMSKQYDEIADLITNQLHRGATVLDGTGWYTKKPVKVLMIVCRKTEMSMMMKAIKSVDQEAFISMNSVMGVYGQGFDTYK